MLAHRTKIVGAIANILGNHPVFKSKLHGIIFCAFNNGFVHTGTYLFGFVYLSIFEVPQTTFQDGFVYILLKLGQWNLHTLS